MPAQTKISGTNGPESVCVENLLEPLPGLEEAAEAGQACPGRVRGLPAGGATVQGPRVAMGHVSLLRSELLITSALPSAFSLSCVQDTSRPPHSLPVPCPSCELCTACVSPHQGLEHAWVQTAAGAGGVDPQRPKLGAVGDSLAFCSVPSKNENAKSTAVHRVPAGHQALCQVPG